MLVTNQDDFMMTSLRLMLADYLVKNHILCTKDEAEVMAEIVLELDDNDENGDGVDIVFSKKDIIIENLVENLDIDEDQARNIVLNLQRQHKLLSSDSNSSSSICSDEDSQEVNSDKDTEESSTIEDNYDDNIRQEEDDGSEYYLIDGECELCDRGDIKVTKHHLIPKSTWSKIRTKLLNAVDAKERGDTNKALLIAGSGLKDSLDRIVLSSEDKKITIRTILHETTCDICRQCHTTVHRTHTNMDLALYFNTVEKLLDDVQISKFCKWNSKQKTGKYRR